VTEPRRPSNTDDVEAPLEETAEALLENAPCGYLSLRPDGIITRVNATFLSWTGLARDDLIGRRRFVDLLTAGGRIYHETHYFPLLRMQGEVREIALEIVCADGRALPVLANTVLRRDADGEPVALHTTVFNASDRKQYERELLMARRREQVDRQRVERLQRITSRLAATLTHREIAEAVVHEAVRDDLVGSAAVGLRESSTGRVALLAADGFEDERAAGSSLRDGWATITSSESTTLVLDGGTGWLPLLIDERAVGLLAVRWDGDEPAAEDVALLAALAAQCAGAFERATLFAEAVRVAERSALLAEASRRMGEVHGAGARAQRLVDLVIPGLADWASVEIREGDLATLLAGTPPPAARDTLRRIELPLGSHGAALGVLTLGRAPARDPFDPESLPFLTDLATRAGLALDIALLLEQSRGVAHALQMSLLAEELPSDPRVVLAACYRPAVAELEVGGDWYDAFRISSDRLGIAVGDVVGRGLAAAIAMGQLRSAIRSLALAQLRPARLLEGLDRFAAQVPNALAATVVYGEVDLASGRLRFACAGHPPPLIAPSHAQPYFTWDGRSAPLGIAHDRGEHELALPAASRLLLFTDGLVERRGELIDTGLERLAREVQTRDETPAAELVETVSDAMVAGQSAHDDICMLCLELQTPLVAHPV
jgi:serine/threonine-protein kinase RsbW